MQAALSALPKAQPRRLVMDEFALFKGHRYASVVLDADTRRVLWIGEGRSRAAVRPFFEELGPEGCAQIEAVAMDMNTAFDLEVRQHCPKARVVYDLFHVVTKYGREVIDRVRVDEANRLRHDKPARKVIKQARWLLLRNPENLKKPEQQVHLQDLLEANQSLMTVYLMKAELKTLWTPSTAWGWRSAWKQWLRHAAYGFKMVSHRSRGNISKSISERSECSLPLSLCQVRHSARKNSATCLIENCASTIVATMQISYTAPNTRRDMIMSVS